MVSENLRFKLNWEFKNQEITNESFDNLLINFAMAFHKEQLRLIDKEFNRHNIALQAMNGLICHFGTSGIHDMDATAERAYKMADALIKYKNEEKLHTM